MNNEARTINKIYIINDVDNANQKVKSIVVEFSDNSFTKIPYTPENQIHINSINDKIRKQIEYIKQDAKENHNKELTDNDAMNLLKGKVVFNLDSKDQASLDYLDEQLKDKIELVNVNNKLEYKNLQVYKDNIEKVNKNKKKVNKVAAFLLAGAILLGIHAHKNKQAPKQDAPIVDVINKDGLDEFSSFLDSEELGLTEGAKLIGNNAFEAAYMNGNVNENLTLTLDDGEVIRQGFETKEAMLNHIKINGAYLNEKDVATLIGQDTYTLEEIAALAAGNSHSWAISFSAMFSEGKVYGDPTLQFLNSVEKNVLKTQVLDHIGKENQNQKIREFLDNQILRGTNSALTIVAFEQILPAYMATNPGAISETDYNNYAQLAETICADMTVFNKALIEKSQDLELYNQKAGLEVISTKGNQILVNYDKHQINYFNKKTGSYEVFNFEHLLQSSKSFAAIYEIVPELKEHLKTGTTNNQSFKTSSKKQEIDRKSQANKKEAEDHVKERFETTKKEAEDKIAQEKIDNKQNREDALTNWESNNKYDDDKIHSVIHDKDKAEGAIKDAIKEFEQTKDQDKKDEGIYIEGSKEKGEDQKLPDAPRNERQQSAPAPAPQPESKPEVVEPPTTEKIEEPEKYDPSKESDKEVGSVEISKEENIFGEYEGYTEDEPSKGKSR